MINFLNKNYFDLEKVAVQNNESYMNAKPFPNITFDNFFNEEVLEKILENFPSNLNEVGNKYDTKAEKKLSLNDPLKFSIETNNFIN